MPASPVMLSDLATVVPNGSIVGADVPITDLVHDSREVAPGAAFIAVRGATVDGHDHGAGACRDGAAALVVDHELDVACPQLVVANTRAAMADLAAHVHGRPAEAMIMVGVTGTNGKTTVTHMLESIAFSAGSRPGIVGTVGAHLAGDVVPLARTTPEATDLQRLLRLMVDRDVEFAALEVSSHSLSFGRVDAIVFDVAVFTNLSQDHLDFHHTMEDYFTAKARLFEPSRARRAVIWIDDPAGARLAAATELPTTTVGFSSSADVVGTVSSLEATGSVVEVDLGGYRLQVRVPMAGRFNAANALLAAAAAVEAGFDMTSIAAGIESLRPVPGRFEPVANDRGLTVVVDYAHTPDAVAASIATAAEISDGRVVAVVGSAGDRDTDKRGPMGAAAATADLAVITSDNPRSEDPAALVAAVLAGAGGPSDAVLTEVDRRAAIRKALQRAKPGDVVLILGKGHETYQEFADRIIDFDDRQVAAEEMAALGGGS